MSAGEVIHTSSTGGQKAGNDVRASLLPWAEIMEVAELYGRGAKKYDTHNWALGYEWSKSFDALQRHLSEFWLGREYDDGEGGTGLPHLSCVAFHVLTLMYFSKHHRALDDRHIPPARPVGTFQPGGLISSRRQVPKLTEAERGSQWRRESSGTIYRWNPDRCCGGGQLGTWEFNAEVSRWDFGGQHPGSLADDSFTELLPSEELQ